MQVILREKIRKLGTLGALVNVKAGYARNFLIPGKKAMMATPANMLRFEADRAALEKVAAGLVVAAEARAAALSALTLSISASAGEGGKLFGSVGTRDIADAITALGVPVEKTEIRLPHGVIRQLGEYDVVIHLHMDVDVEIKMNVVAA